METERFNKMKEISKLLGELYATDYITDKLLIAVVHYILTDDKSKVIEMYNEYKLQIDDRQLNRDKINALRKELQQATR